MKQAAFSATLLLSIALSLIAHEQVFCGRNHAAFAPPDSAAHRKYAPDRTFDLLHCADSRCVMASSTYVEQIVRHYLDQRESGERFAQWVARAEEGSLR